MTHRIAVIAGDGIGKEVMPEGLRVLDAASRRFGIALQLDPFDFASCIGVDRVLKFAFELARTRPRRRCSMWSSPATCSATS